MPRLLREDLFSAGSIMRNSGKNIQNKNGVRMNISVGNLPLETIEEDLLKPGPQSPAETAKS